MVHRQYYTKNYKHEYFFTFKGEKYLVHSIVHLTEKGKIILQTSKPQVILTEHFIDFHDKEWWTYEIGWVHGVNQPLRVSTDDHPDQLVASVAIPAHSDYTERELFGVQASSYTHGIKQEKKDWKIPEMRKAWFILILIFLCSSLFKDWYVKLIIRAATIWFFYIYRTAYKNAYTTYIHDDDMNILKKKYEILYNVKFDKENNNNE